MPAPAAHRTSGAAARSGPARRPPAREGFKATSRIIALGFALDAVYQFKTVGTFYLGEAVVVVFFLAFLPYLLVRGPADRIARWWLARKAASKTWRAFSAVPAPACASASHMQGFTAHQHPRDAAPAVREAITIRLQSAKRGRTR